MLENFEILLMFYLHTILHANVNLGRALKPFLNKVDKFENNKTKLKNLSPRIFFLVNWYFLLSYEENTIH